MPLISSDTGRHRAQFDKRRLSDVLNNVLGTKFKIVTAMKARQPPCCDGARGSGGHSATYDGLKTQHPIGLRKDESISLCSTC